VSYQARVRVEAERDIEEAALWYERQRDDLGQAFLDEVLRTLALIEAHPELYPVLHREVRRALLRSFPFGVFYRIERQQIVVLAVAHAKRDPALWKQRD
jgi:plasmid stabilization system protein ParE